ncbi:MAG: hypothetical protein E7417_00690 [Ruminococcaceae bacterium]|nr:hypothetical protein [Oscillospiraceae bacterium]
MKNYIRPSVEVSKFDVADIITVSGHVMEASSLAPESTDAALYDAYKAVSSVDSANVAVFQW